MIHINTKTNPAVLTAGGSPADIAADFCFAIGNLYSAMCKADRQAGEIFRNAIVSGLMHPDSPTWKLQPRPGKIAVATRIPRERD